MKILILLSLLVQLIAIPAITNPVFNQPACNEKSSLTDRKWEMQEIRFLQDNTNYYYKNGDGEKSNMNFDNDYIVFNCDGSGSYHQGDNRVFSLKWHSLGDNAIGYTISNFRNNSDLKLVWENIELSGNAIKYVEYYTHKTGIHSLGYATRICKDSASPNTL